MPSYFSMHSCPADALGLVLKASLKEITQKATAERHQPGPSYVPWLYWVAVKELESTYSDEDTLSFTIYPCYAN